MVRAGILYYVLLLLFHILIVITSGLKERKLHLNKKDCQVQCQVWCDQTVVSPAQSTTSTVVPSKPQNISTTTQSVTEPESDEDINEIRHKRFKRIKINNRLHKKLIHTFKQKYRKTSRKIFSYKDFPSNCKVICTQPTPIANPSSSSENEDNDDGAYVPGEDNPIEITAEPPQLFNQYVAPNLFNWDGFDEFYEDPLVLIEGKKKQLKLHKKHRKGQKIKTF